MPFSTSGVTSAYHVSMHDVLGLEQVQPTCHIPQKVQQAQHVLLVALWLPLGRLERQCAPETQQRARNAIGRCADSYRNSR